MVCEPRPTICNRHSHILRWSAIQAQTSQGLRIPLDSLAGCAHLPPALPNAHVLTRGATCSLCGSPPRWIAPSKGILYSIPAQCRLSGAQVHPSFCSTRHTCGHPLVEPGQPSDIPVHVDCNDAISCKWQLQNPCNGTHTANTPCHCVGFIYNRCPELALVAIGPAHLGGWLLFIYIYLLVLDSQGNQSFQCGLKHGTRQSKAIEKRMHLTPN